MRKSVDLARKEIRRGSAAKTSPGSISPLGWLRTKMSASDAGTSCARLVSMRRKKRRSATLMTAWTSLCANEPPRRSTMSPSRRTLEPSGIAAHRRKCACQTQISGGADVFNPSAPPLQFQTLSFSSDSGDGSPRSRSASPRLLARRQQVPQLHSGLVELRLGGADRAAQQARHLLVLVPLHVV